MNARYSYVCWLAVCAAAGIPSLGLAQTVPRPAASPPSQRMPLVDTASGISLDDLVAAALQRAPQLAASRTEIDAARGELRQAALRSNPSVAADRQEEIGGTDTRSVINLAMPLDVFRRAGRVAAARRVLDVVSISVLDRERLLAAGVRQNAGRALAELRNLEVTGDLLDVARRSRDLLQARVTEGAAPALELQVAELETRRLEAQQALQTGRVEAAFVELKAAAGLEPDAPLTLRNTLEEMVLGGPSEVQITGPEGPTLETLVRDRADVREAGARVNLAEARIDQKRREGRMDMGLYAAYMRMDSGFPQQGLDAEGRLTRVRGLFHNVMFGATVSIPLWNRNQGSIAAAEAERAGAERTREARSLAARAEIAAASARERAARRAANVYRTVARGLARDNLNVARESYELGHTTLFDVLAEQRRVLETEMAFTEALLEAYEARTVLRTARGDTK